MNDTKICQGISEQPINKYHNLTQWIAFTFQPICNIGTLFETTFWSCDDYGKLEPYKDMTFSRNEMDNLCRQHVGWKFQNEEFNDVTLANMTHKMRPQWATDPMFHILRYEEVWWRAIIWGGALSREGDAHSTSQLSKAAILHFCNSILADPGEMIEKCANSLRVFSL